MHPLPHRTVPRAQPAAPPSQVLPSPAKPDLQVQVWLPISSVQVA
jgi:hypothetical protein